MSEKDTEAIREEVPGENPVSGANGPSDVGAPRCPLCGGLVTQRWRSISTFVSVTFCISLFLTPVLFRACTAGAGPILFIPFVLCAGIALLSFWAMPAAGAIAVVARPCCRRCGHPFLRVSDDSHQPTESPFPRWPVVAGSIILLVTLVVCLVWLRTAPGLETGKGGLTYFSRVLIAGFVLGSGLLAQVLLWRRVGMRMTNTVRQGMLLLLPIIVLGAGWLALTGYDHRALSRKYDPIKRSPEVLDRAGLAALPPSAREVRVHSWAFMLSGKHTLRFAAEPNDVEQFLGASPSLEGKEALGRNHRDTSYRPREVPHWYKRDIRGPSRRYGINWRDGMYQGELIVDDEHHTVFVHVARF